MNRCSKCSRFLYYGLEHECKPIGVTLAELAQTRVKRVRLPRRRKLRDWRHGEPTTIAKIEHLP